MEYSKFEHPEQKNQNPAPKPPALELFFKVVADHLSSPQLFTVRDKYLAICQTEPFLKIYAEIAKLPKENLLDLAQHSKIPSLEQLAATHARELRTSTQVQLFDYLNQKITSLSGLTQLIEGYQQLKKDPSMLLLSLEKEYQALAIFICLLEIFTNQNTKTAAATAKNSA